MPATSAVLGFRPHTYWTAAVALAGEPQDPEVIERRRIDFASGDERSVYHRVETMAADEAEAWIARVWAACEADTRRGVGQLVEDLAGSGVSLGVAVVPIGRAKHPDKFEDIIKSHSHMHAAEGDFYRAIVATACTNLGLEVRRVVERDLPGRVGQLLRIDGAAIDQRMKAIGAALGPPWTEDQKLATLAAWSCLADAGDADAGAA
jgi:hypothetical protein